MSISIKSIFITGLCCMGMLHAYTPPSAAVSALNSYRSYSDLTSAAGSMDIDTYTKNMITWQMPHGGFFKAYASKYVSPWNGTAARSDQVRNGVELGTIDNNATIQEMRLMAVRYKATTNATNKSTYKAAFQKAIGFITTSQQSKGSWPQMYPARGNYSDMATYNDNAMIRVMVLAKDIAERAAPFDSDIATDAQRTQLQTALNKAIDFALKAQIINNGQPTVWCAQHNPTTYAPVAARSYELESKSGSESAGIVWMLMNWPDQTAAVQSAVKGALAWYKRTRVADMKFSSGSFVSSPGSSMWYRFYEVANDQYFFCDREGVSTKTQDITQISDERRTGYQWAGDYGSKLLAAESAYLAAIATAPISSVTPSSSSITPLSSSVIQSSSSVVISSSSILTPTVADCGGSACTNVLQGESYCNVQGVTESKNAGYMGTGYVNVDNAIGSSVGYTLQASTAIATTLYIRYANGTTGTRNAKISSGNQTLVADFAFPSTGSWTTWAIIPISVNLPAGRDSLVLQSLTADGLANVDWIGWKGSNPSIGNCEAPTSLFTGTTTATMTQPKLIHGQLHFTSLPQGVWNVRIRDLYGKIIETHKISNQEMVVSTKLGKGAFIVELMQNQKPLRWIITSN